MINNLDIIIYGILIAFTVICIRNFVKDSGKKNTKNNSIAKIALIDLAITKYISEHKGAIFIQTSNVAGVHQASDRLSELKGIIPDGNLSSFVMSIKSKFIAVIDAFKNNDLETLCCHLTDNLYESFRNRIDLLRQCNVTRQIDVDCRMISITNCIADVGRKAVECDLLVNQLSSVNDEHGRSYDNPNAIYQTIQYNIHLDEDCNSKNWLISKISYSDVLE